MGGTAKRGETVYAVKALAGRAFPKYGGELRPLLDAPLSHGRE